MLGNESLLRGYDFMCGAVWPEISQQLMTRVNNLFSPGNPDMFHANYTVTLTFLSRLEGIEIELVHFRSNGYLPL